MTRAILSSSLVSLMCMGVVACGEDATTTDTGAGGAGAGTGGTAPVAGTLGAGAGTAGVGTVAGTAGVTAGTAGVTGGTTGVTAGTGATGGTGTAGTAAAPAGEGDVTSVAGDLDGASQEDFGFPGVAGAFYFGDDVTTAEGTISAGSVCIRGVAADAGPDYVNYGAGLGLQLSYPSEDETTNIGFDAVTAGIAKMRFTLTGIDTYSAKIRLGVPMTNVAGVSDNFESNAWIIDGKTSNDFDADGTYTVALAELMAPEWVSDEMGTLAMDGVTDFTFDASRIHAIQLQVATVMKELDYNFCITNFEWLDAADAVVANVPMTPTYADGAGMPMGGAGGVAGAAGMMDAGMMMDDAGTMMMDDAGAEMAGSTAEMGGAGAEMGGAGAE